MKTIAILGGMGPMASHFAHIQVLRELAMRDKRANIVHFSLDIEPFYAKKPVLRLTKQHKELLWQHKC